MPVVQPILTLSYQNVSWYCETLQGKVGQWCKMPLAVFWFFMKTLKILHTRHKTYREVCMAIFISIANVVALPQNQFPHLRTHLSLFEGWELASWQPHNFCGHLVPATESVWLSPTNMCSWLVKGAWLCGESPFEHPALWKCQGKVVERVDCRLAFFLCC